MSSSSNAVYVITGGNSGLGLGLVKALLARPSTTVVATVRNEDTARTLEAELGTATPAAGSSWAAVPIDLRALPARDNLRAAFEALVPHVDVLINNAGTAGPMDPVAETSAEDLRLCFEVNTISPLSIFQALWPLLKKSPSGTPKVINVTSSLGCITRQEAFPGGAYGPSKAALNWITRALHGQNEADGLVAVALHPGFVRTRMGDAAAREWELGERPPESVEGSVGGMLEVINAATREKYSGQLVSYRGDIMDW